MGHTIQRMQRMQRMVLIGGVILSAVLAGCAQKSVVHTETYRPPPRHVTHVTETYQAPPAPAPIVNEYGHIEQIEVVKVQKRGQTSGTGAVIGAVAGGVLGNQVGKGNGRAAATVVGAVGGAVAGNAIEGHNNSTERIQGYRLKVRMDRGDYRIYNVGSVGGLQVGDRVRVHNGKVSRY